VEFVDGYFAAAKLQIISGFEKEALLKSFEMLAAVIL